MNLVPGGCYSALDIGARDGHFSKLLTGKFQFVTALDLDMPSISHPNIKCVKGNIAKLQFDDNSFDCVFCAEVIEHIPAKSLSQACSELSRVCKKYLIIGVPYKQDIRVGRTTCYSCGKKNPPWGHINTFDINKLKNLFPLLDVEKISYVGDTNISTNFISTFLMDLAGNPYGTYEQDEQCIYCSQKLMPPSGRNILQKILTKVAIYIEHFQKPFVVAHPQWIHILFKK